MAATKFARWLRFFISAYCLLVLAGCSQPRSEKSLSLSDPASYLSAREVADKVSNSQQPILVEFSVPAGCYRCNEMKSQIDVLAKERQDRLQVCRVNFNFERSLTAQWEINVCPTYVVFEAGEELFRLSYPTTGDMLAAKLDSLLGDDLPTTNQEY